MPDSDDLHEVRFRNHQPREKTPPPGFEDAGGGAFVHPNYQRFVEAAMKGKLPDLGDIPQRDPKVVALAEELMVIHLPEWVAANGRKLAAPSQMKISGAVRVAEYLLQRGVDIDPEKATVRWVPTPGANLGAGDPGKHIYRNADGTWPEDPDAEAFWDVAEIECQQLDDGRWVAVHPRGIQCEDASKTEAYAMCVERVRARVAELKGNS
ncbi:hypothetical protein [Nocardia otitidiscaviarum]|uniref:hypothetical protein n=1 Tax=Nocardia otitidiscaviarum TaxID=1823 RepID=UPI0004A7726B|nr:hypothetical protein [Nocardia otitidiscaviarum]